MIYDRHPKPLPSLEVALAEPSSADSDLPSLKSAFSGGTSVGAAPLPSLVEALAPDSTPDATPDDVREQAPPRLDIEFNATALVSVDFEQIGHISAMIRAMKEAGEQPMTIEHAIYRELEGMSIDLSTVRGGAVVVEVVYPTGEREPHAMNILPQDFGAMLRHVNLHAIEKAGGEYAGNQDELLEALEAELSQKATDVTRTLDVEACEIPSTMMDSYKDAIARMLQDLHRGQLSPPALNDFMKMTVDIRTAYLREQEMRGNRERAVVPEALTEDTVKRVNAEFDDDYLGTARNRVSKFNEKLLDLKQRLAASTRASADMTMRLTNIGAEITEMLHDRHGQDQHRHSLIGMLNALNRQFEDEQGSRVRTLDAVNQL